MANTACHFLSNKYSIQSDFGRLKYSPCCWYDSQIYFDDPEFTKKVSAVQTQTSCYDCGLNHSNATQRSYDQIPENIAIGIPVVLELSIDSECNGACLSCNPGLSSTWRAQEIKFNIKSKEDYPDPLLPADIVKNLTTVVNFESVTRIEILGGEPFKSLTTELVLAHAVESNVSRNIDLMINTNGTVTPSAKVLELIAKFHSVLIIVSIDAIEDQFMYMRYPLSWSKLLDNLEFFKNLDIKKQIQIGHTYGALNALTYEKFKTWSDNFFSDCPDYHGSFINRCDGVVGLNSAPRSLLEQAQRDNAKYAEVLKFINPALHRSQVECTDLVNYLNQWDSYRRTSWEKTFPELITHLKGKQNDKSVS